MLQALKSKTKRIATTLAAGVLLFSQFAVVPTASASHNDGPKPNDVAYWCNTGVKFDTGAVGTHSQNVTGGSVSITIVDPDKTEISNVSSTGGVQVTKVVVKGGSETYTGVIDGNIAYTPAFNYNLKAPFTGNWPHSWNQADISHVIVCYTVETGDIKVKKYEDVNGNSQLDNGENDDMSGWKVRLYNSDWTLVDDLTTDDSDWRTFEDLPLGTYYLCEKNQSDWMQTDPNGDDVASVVNNSPNKSEEAARCWQVILTSNNKEQYVRFGNQEIKYGSITIQKDAEPNSTDNFAFTSNVPGNANFTLDNDQGVPGGNNTYLSSKTFENLIPGTPYTFTELDTAGWYLHSVTCKQGEQNVAFQQDGSTITVTLASDQDVTCKFVNKKTGTLKVVKDVVNDNGGKKTYSDFSFTANGTPYAFDAKDGDDYDGVKEITVKPGSYTVVEPEANTMGYTTSYSNCDNVTVTAGETTICVITNNDNAPVLTVTKDAHPNSHQPFGFTLEKLVFGEGWEELESFYLNDNGINFWLDDNKTFDDLSTGWYKVTEAETKGWYLDAIHCSGAHELVNLMDRSVVVKLHLGSDVNCEFENKKYGMIWGAKFEDLNKDGQWSWGEPLLSDWTITLDKWFDGQPAIETVTDENGFYKFEDLKPGKYTVCEVQQDGWVQTKPDTESGCKFVILGTGDVEYVKFGNFQYGKVYGVKFNDANGNGVRDEGESTLKNWEITLTKLCEEEENNEEIAYRTQDESGCEEVTQTTKTDATGAYSFGDLDLGTYVVCEVQQANWTQTAPKTKDGCVEFTVETSGHEEVVDFGNKAKPQVLGEQVTLAVTGAGTASKSLAIGLTILSVLGALHMLTNRRKDYVR